MATDENFEAAAYACPECHLGTLQPGTAFYCSWLQGEFISAPDFPAWICDVCGRREYDEESVQELQTLLHLERDERDRRRRTDSTSPDPTGQDRLHNPDNRG
ncbi:MAG TPA: YgiT-type zinc finger protein [Anaerolineales bacterium]